MRDYQKENLKNGNHLARWSLTLVLLFALAALVFVLVKIATPQTTAGEEEVFAVAPGESGRQISQKLEEAGLIRSPFFFDLYIYLKGYSTGIKAGNYLLSPSQSIREIARKLVSGEAITDDVRLTIIPGWGISEVAGRVEELALSGRTEFISIVGQPLVGGADDFSGEFEFLKSVPVGSSLEGFLFPDTYFIDKQATAEDVVRKLLGNFERKAVPELELSRLWRASPRAGINPPAGGKELSLYEIVTLASIVEREVGRNLKKGSVLSEAEKNRISEERRIVAGIFLNRLELGMALESDATVGYITGSLSARATLAETRISSPYNTYQNRGLPPGPISSPSLDSIIAAADPAETNYLFFLTAPAGEAYFAETFEQHQRNREQYLNNN